jgi:hypothetical protein
MALSYNWSITDQSPLITYTPLSLGNETTIWNSWNSSYSLTPWNVSELSDYTSLVGKGQSSHTSTAAQASAKIGFAGTAVYVWGESQTFRTHGTRWKWWCEVWQRSRYMVSPLHPSSKGMSFPLQLLINRTPVNATIDLPLQAVNGNLNVTGNWHDQYATSQDGALGARSSTDYQQFLAK